MEQSNLIKNEPENFKIMCDLWLKNKRNKLKLSTISKYQYILEHYIIPELGSYNLTEINSQVIDTALCNIYYNVTATISYSLIKSILYIVNAVLKFGERSDFINHVCINFEFANDNYNEIQILAREQEIEIVKRLVKEKNYNHLGILISLYTGIRLGEVCSLQKKDIDLNHAIIYVHTTVQRLKREGSSKTELIITKPKSKKSYREIPIPKFLQDVFYQYEIQNMNTDFFVLGNKPFPFEPRTLQYAFNRLIEECNIHGLHFHCLRHTFATKCIEVGFDVKTLSEILGHSSVNFTLNQYVHSSMERKKQQMELINKNWKMMSYIS